MPRNILLKQGILIIACSIMKISLKHSQFYRQLIDTGFHLVYRKVQYTDLCIVYPFDIMLLLLLLCL